MNKLLFLFIISIFLFSSSIVSAELDTKTLHYWTFDETSGTTLYDSVKTKNVTASNSDMLNQNGIINKSVYSGVYTRNINFNGISGMKSMNFWVYPLSSSLMPIFYEDTINHIHINDRWSGNQPATTSLGMAVNNKFYSWTQSDLGLTNQYLPTNEWSMISIVWNGSDSNYYASINNGSLVSATKYNNPTEAVDWGAFYFAKPTSGDNTNARIDEFAIFNESITQEDIGILYNGGNGLQYPFTVVETVNITSVEITTNTTTLEINETYYWNTSYLPTNATSVTWNVSLGDGTYSTSENGTKSYSTDGIYNLSINATDGQGNSVYDWLTITVLPEETTNITSVTLNTPTSAVTNISFSWNITYLPTNATGVTLFTDFDDGTNSTSSSGSKTYTSEGTYNISVVATDGQGNSVYDYYTISIFNPANISVSIDTNYIQGVLLYEYFNASISVEKPNPSDTINSVILVTNASTNYTAIYDSIIGNTSYYTITNNVMPSTEGPISFIPYVNFSSNTSSLTAGVSTTKTLYMLRFNYTDYTYTSGINPVFSDNISVGGLTYYSILRQSNSDAYSYDAEELVTPYNYDVDNPYYSLLDFTLQGLYTNYSQKVVTELNTSTKGSSITFAGMGGKTLYMYPSWASVFLTNASSIYHYTNYNSTTTSGVYPSFSRYYYFEDTCTILTNSTGEESDIIQLYPFGIVQAGYPTDQLLTAVTIRDADGFEKIGVTLKVQRRLANGEYVQIESVKTNSEGIALVRLVQYRGLYRFIVQEDCETIFISEPTQIQTNQITISVPTDIGLNLFSNTINSIDYSLTSNNTTGTYTLIYNSNNNLGGNNCLVVERITNTGYTETNSSCTTSSTGTITLAYNTGYSSRATYYYDDILVGRIMVSKNVEIGTSFRDTGGTIFPILILLMIVGLSALMGSIIVGLILLGFGIIILSISGFLVVNTSLAYGMAFGLFVLAYMIMNRR